MENLRIALIIAGIVLVVVVYFVSARGRREDQRAGEFEPSGAWSDNDADPLLDDLEATTINPRLNREDRGPSATEPSATEPAATEPAATEPSATEPSATEPSATEPAAAAHAATPDSAGEKRAAVANTDTATDATGSTHTDTTGAGAGPEPVTPRGRCSEATPASGRDSGAVARANNESRVLSGIDAVSEELEDAREPHIGSLDALDNPRDPPPVAVKKKRAPAKKKAAARKKSSGKSPRGRPPASPVQPELPAGVEPLAIVINIMAREGAHFPGVDVEEALQEAGLRFGEMQLFHFRSETQPEGTLPIFTALNMVKPGTLSPEEFQEMNTPGIALVLRLPGVEEPARAFELMHTACQSIADYLGGTLCDQSRSHLTPQALNHLREEITEYSRKLLIPTG